MESGPVLCQDPPFTISGFACSEITSNDTVDLLGVTLDNILLFDHHINELCNKAGEQLNALKRLGPFISKKTRCTFQILLGVSVGGQGWV